MTSRNKFEHKSRALIENMQRRRSERITIFLRGVFFLSSADDNNRTSKARGCLAISRQFQQNKERRAGRNPKLNHYKKLKKKKTQRFYVLSSPLTRERGKKSQRILVRSFFFREKAASRRTLYISIFAGSRRKFIYYFDLVLLSSVASSVLALLAVAFLIY